MSAHPPDEARRAAEDRPRRSFLSRLWGYLTAPGVIWWGIPLAVISSVWQHVREEGAGWDRLFTTRFFIRLVIALIITGVIGGNLFQWIITRAGFRFPTRGGR